jgi:quercetin dioxygenase-like cupin family protein
MSDFFITDNYQITNKVTGQVVKFLPSDDDPGGLLEMETLYTPFSAEPPVHYHPYQEEYFRVLEGELTVRLNGEVRIYQEGAVIHIKQRVKHSMWNSGFKTALVSWKVMPAMDTEDFLRTMTWLSNNGETNAKGVPSLPAMVFLLRKYRRIFRLDKPPQIILSILYVLLTPVFFLLHYKRKFNNPTFLKSKND